MTHMIMMCYNNISSSSHLFVLISHPPLKSYTISVMLLLQYCCKQTSVSTYNIHRCYSHNSFSLNFQYHNIMIVIGTIPACNSSTNNVAYKSYTTEKTQVQSSSVTETLTKSGKAVSAKASKGDVLEDLRQRLEEQARRIEELEALPQPAKNYICYSDEDTHLEVSLFEPDANDLDPPLDNDDYNFVNVTDFDGHFDFGKVNVSLNQDILVDLTASTGSLYFTGNIDTDVDDFSELADIAVSENTDMDNVNWNSVNEASVSIGIELIPSVGGAISPVPEAMVTLSSFEDVFAWDNDDFDADDAVFFQKKEMSTHSAKYLFPNLNAGEYDIKVRIMLKVGAELFDRSEIENQVLTKVVLGPHFIKASVLDSEEVGECAAITEITRRG